jgi:hypothetical protein
VKAVSELESILPRRLVISNYALVKAFAYARLVALEREGCECIGYLLADAQRPDLLVDDVLLAPDQQVTPTSVRIEGGAVLSAAREIQERGRRVVGWWHSHGPDMDPFHSCVDDRSTEQLVQEIAPIGLQHLRERLPVKVQADEAGLRLSTGARLLGALRFDGAAPDGFRKESEAVLECPIPVGFVFSLVVNTHGQTYSEIAARRWCGFCRRIETSTFKVDLQVVSQPNCPAVDPAALRDEVRRKVRIARRLDDDWPARAAGEEGWPRPPSLDGRPRASGQPNGRRSAGSAPDRDRDDACAAGMDLAHSSGAASSRVDSLLQQVLTEVRELRSLITSMAESKESSR